MTTNHTVCLGSEAAAVIGFLQKMMWRCSSSLPVQTSMIRQLAITACVASDRPPDSGW